MASNTEKAHLAMYNGRLDAERTPRNYQRRDDGSHIFHNEEEYYEWWYFDAAFSSGYHAVIVFHYRNLFLQPMQPSIQLFIYLPDGSRKERYALISPEAASANPDYCDVRMGDAWVKETGGRYELYMKIKGIGARLSFTSRTPPWKPGTGFNYKDEAEGLTAGWVVPVPEGHAAGELYLKEETVPVAGTGYHDHNWGNYHCWKTFQFWYWGRIHHARYAIDYAWVAPRREGAPVHAPLMIARDGEIVLSTNKLNMEFADEQKDAATGQAYARRLFLNASAAGVELDMRIVTRRVIESAQLPQVTEWPHYYLRFLADYEMRVSVDGEAETVQGQLLHELMLL
jgi:predicted secreted hydrolase